MDEQVKYQKQLLGTAMFLLSYSRRSVLYRNNPLFWDLMMGCGKSILETCGITPKEDDERWFWQASEALDNIRETASEQAHNPLKQLWDTTEAFFKRFDCYPPDKQAQYGAFKEEVDEFKDETAPTYVTEFIPDRICEESADVLVTMMGILMSHNISYDDFIQQILRVAAKNAAKTDETHFVSPINGKITRKQL